jgi:hypothetical protein
MSFDFKFKCPNCNADLIYSPPLDATHQEEIREKDDKIALLEKTLDENSGSWIRIGESFPNYDIAVVLWDNRTKGWLLATLVQINRPDIGYIGDGWLVGEKWTPVSVWKDVTHWRNISVPKDILT